MEKLTMIRQLLTDDFCKFLIALSMIMLANAVTGAMKAWKESKFSFKELGIGVLGYIAWAIGAACTVAGLQLYGGDLEVTIGETTITLLNAVEIAKKGIYLYWSAKAVQNFMEYGKLKSEVTVTPIEEFNNFEIKDDEEE